jgi:phage terminase large subunit
MFQRTKAINKLLKLDKFIKGVQGGSSAGKTYGIIPIEIDYAIKNPGTETSIVSESIPHLKRGAMKDFIKIMQTTNRWNANNWNATDFKYKFSNGSYIEFFSADTDSKLRGARRDRLYINEANNVSFHAYTELAMRTKESIFLDWNPTNSFWFHEELMNDSNVDFTILTYMDNEAAPSSAIDFILRAKEKALKSNFWDNWYKVYGLGQLGVLEGVIFTEYKEIDNLPPDAKLLGIGLDFGFTNDPTTAMGLYKHNEGYIWHELLYMKGLVNREIAGHLKPYGAQIVADSSEPKSIAELNQYGLNVQGAVKGSDSVVHGIQLLQSVPWSITKSSTNAIKELRHYSWDKNREGETRNYPIDMYNHCIDSMRYIAQKHLVKQTATKAFSYR